MAHARTEANGVGGARLKALGGYTTMIGRQAATEGPAHTSANARAIRSTQFRNALASMISEIKDFNPIL
jgi:hypothetical protein